MLKFYLAAFLFFVLNVIHAQQKIIVTGRITDNKKYPLPNITITFNSSKDSTVLYRTQTDVEGRYQFNNITIGNYFMKASAAGMKDAYTSSFSITNSTTIFYVDIIQMANAVNTLKDVTVTTETKPVEVKQGKLVYNVEKSITASGSSAFEILRKTPGISIDQDENLLLKGNTNVNVMIDGKMTYLSSEQLTTLLKSMPAESITLIEVSANPSSEFDAAGNAGVINIITKKLNRDGYALNVGALAGTGRYPNTTENVAGNVKTKRFNFFGSYTYNYKKSYLNRTSYRVINDGNNTIVYDRHSFDPDKTSNHSYKTGIDFYINKNNQLNFVYNGYSNNWKRNGAGPTYLREISGKGDSLVQNHNITHAPQHNNAYDINYTAKLDTSGSTFSLDADYASYKSNSSGYLSNQIFTNESEPLQPYQQLNFNQPGDIKIRSVKTDLNYAFNKISFKAGLKYADVRSDNNSVYDSLINNEYVFSTALSNHFIYDEKIFAGYVSANKQFNKTSIDAGVRIENTASTGNSITAKIVTKKNYTDAFPYISVDETINDDNKLGVSVARRINRPVYSNLNPFRYFFDKYSYYEGNPFLQPEYAWNTTLSYTLKDKYIAQLTYSYTSNPISEFATQDAASGTLKVTTYNFSHRNNYSALFIIPVSIGKVWNMQNTVNVFYDAYNFEQVNFSVHKLATELSTTQTFKLPKDIAAELTADYETPSISGTYILHHWFTMDAGLKKSIKKLDIRLAVTDIFKSIHYWGYSAYNETNVSYNHRPDSRRISLGLLYHFGGKLSEVKREKLEEENRIQ